jgi:pimeloyl-ACP methyl ester carboxylesterase
MYEASNGFSTPPSSSKYGSEFLSRYRAAQLDRVRRLDVYARSLLSRQSEAAELLPAATGSLALRLQRQERMGWHMVIYRTSADPAAVDLSIEPDDRSVGSYFSNRPDIENYGDSGFARYVTPRAWLSTWSALSSKVRTADNLESIGEPLLVVHYAGDAATRLSEAREMEARSGAADKRLVIIPNADHYGCAINGDGRTGPRTTAGTVAVVQWMLERFPP